VRVHVEISAEVTSSLGKVIEPSHRRERNPRGGGAMLQTFECLRKARHQFMPSLRGSYARMMSHHALPSTGLHGRL
jgi:hypothetical protein